MTTITAQSGGGNWNSTSTWSTGTVPTAADDVILGPLSGNVTINLNSVARSLDCTGYVGTLTHNSSCTLTLGDATAGAGNVVLKLDPGMTYTKINSTNSAMTVASTSATQQTVTTAGKALGNLTVSGAGSSVLFADDLTCAALLVSSAATAAFTGRTVTATTVTVTGAGTSAAISGATFNLTSTATGTVFLRTNAAAFTGTTATITITTASANVRDIAIGTTNVAFTVNYTLSGSTGTLRFTSAANLAAVNFSDASNARTLSFNAATTFTIGQFNVQGSAGQPVSVVSGTSGSAATLSKTSGVVSADFLSLKDITATGGACWYAGANSSVVSGVSGWMLTPPSNYQFLQFAGV